jgi:predicted DNA-binding protein (UPF0251 family)
MAKPNPIPTKISQQVIEKFLTCINRSPGQGPNGNCHEWLRGKSGTKYGSFVIDGRAYTATRIAYYLATGEDPGELLVCHTCDNPPCCREDHLFKGTGKDNSQDMVHKNRHAFGEKNGMIKHPESRLYGCNHWTHKKPECLNKGVNVNTAKLKPEDVREIRRLHANKNITAKQASERFGIVESTFHRIINRTIWKHIR